MNKSGLKSVLHVYDETLGAIQIAKGHHGMPITCDYETAIGMGVMAGHSQFHGQGRRDALATTPGGDDISDIAATTITYPDQSTGSLVSLVSDSANDTAAGSGARTVKIHYLTPAGVYAHTVVTMNGTTAVATGTLMRFIQQITVETNGSFGATNAGNITAHLTGTPATIYSRIVAGNNVSMSSARMVPAGYDFWLSDIMASATSSKAVSVRLTATCDHAGEYINGVFQFNQVIELQDSVAVLQLKVPRKIPSLAIIFLLASS